MRELNFFLTILLLFSFAAIAQTTISGDISGLTFKPSGNPWVVKDNLFIENNGKTVIKAGCIFLFKPFTGIVVNGTLNVEGLSESPVIFTSINDGLYNEASPQKPEPFDWNGIIIEKSTEAVKISNFLISYSVFGIKAKNENIVLENGVFRENGQFNFTINDKIIDVVNNLPFTYNLVGKIENPYSQNSKGWIKPVGISSVVVGTGFLGTMGYFIFYAFDQDKKYANTKQKDDIHSYVSEIDKAVKYSVITGIIGGILVSIGAGLLAWEYNTKDNTVSVYPVIGKSNGFQFVIDF